MSKKLSEIKAELKNVNVDQGLTAYKKVKEITAGWTDSEKNVIKLLAKQNYIYKIRPEKIALWTNITAANFIVGALTYDIDNFFEKIPNNTAEWMKLYKSWSGSKGVFKIVSDAFQKLPISKLTYFVKVGNKGLPSDYVNATVQFKDLVYLYAMKDAGRDLNRGCKNAKALIDDNKKKLQPAIDKMKKHRKTLSKLKVESTSGYNYDRILNRLDRRIRKMTQTVSFLETFSERIDKNSKDIKAARTFIDELIPQDN